MLIIPKFLTEIYVHITVWYMITYALIKSLSFVLQL